MDTLFHYCSSEKFRSIVESRTLRLSSLTLSNDTSEGKMVVAAISRLAERDGLSATLAQRLLAFVESLDSVLDGLGFCMSEESDQLSQWRGYADDGFGVAIGFSKEYLDLLAARLNEQNPETFQIHLDHAVYDPADHDARVEPTYREAKKYIDEGALDYPGIRGLLDTRTDEEVEAEKRIWQELSTKFGRTIFMLFLQLFLLKSPAFQEENEWRLISHRGKKSGGPCDFHAIRDRLVPFKPIWFEELKVQPITDVVLGPKHLTPELVIQDFLAQRGFADVSVRKSSASYR